MKCFCVASALLLAGCASKASLATKASSEIDRLSPNLVVEAQLGKAPVALPDAEGIARYRIRTPEQTEFLVVLYREQVRGEISIASAPPAAEAAAAIQLTGRDDYFDRLLRAQRRLLRGDLPGAKGLAEALESEYQKGFGTSLILATAAFLAGDRDAARVQFRYAKELMPKGKGLESLINF